MWGYIPRDADLLDLDAALVPVGRFEDTTGTMETHRHLRPIGDQPA